MEAMEDRVNRLEEKCATLEKRFSELGADSRSQISDKEKEARLEAGDRADAGKSLAEPPPSSPSSQRFRVLLNSWDRRSGERKDSPADGPALPFSDIEDSQQYAWQLRKFTNAGDLEEDDDSEVEIFGAELRDLLKKLLGGFPHHWFIGETVTLYSPYEPLVLNWDRLVEESEKKVDDETEQIGRNDLKDLLRTLQQGSGDDKLDTYFKSRDSLKASNSITFQNLWTLFHPGMLVHSRPFNRQDQIFIVMESVQFWPSKRHRSRAYDTWFLRCFTYDWDGQRFLRRLINLRIEPFEGPKPIGTLSVQPLESMPNARELKARLLERGRKFQRYCTLATGQRLFKYEGPAIFDKTGFRGLASDDASDTDDDETLSRRRSNYTAPGLDGSYSLVESDVMVDFESYYKYGRPITSIGELLLSDEDGECGCEYCSSNQALQALYCTHFDNDYNRAEPAEWEPLQYQLCAPRVLGYILRSKTWAQLDVNCLKTIDPTGASDAFINRLMLPGRENGRETKELLMGLVKNHGMSESSSRDAGYQLDDIVADKGKGLVILLYGPPGVGKTSTAQTIAIAAGKPLFSIGVADVGTTAKNVESNLETIFDLATTWKAVLLIDEADVFLQSRSLGELGPALERNALVSVFLRVLEYYQGILILTTNQIAQFDVAVQSRIHIAIKYEALTEGQTEAIFSNFLHQYTERDLVDHDSVDNIKKWMLRELPRKKFDGRQIRNAITSAMGIARSRGSRSKMTYDDLLRVVEIMHDFKADLAYQMMQYEDSQKTRLH